MGGSIFIVSAPSGAGKSSLVGALLTEDPRLRLSISYTTRLPRGSEVDGREYHFVPRETFLAMRDRGEFLECAEVHGNFYGTSKSWIESQVTSGQDVVLEIDPQGAAQLREVFANAVSVFVLPPSMAELERRLRGRGTEEDAVVERRLNAATAELREAPKFDYAIINSDFSDALARLKSVVVAARQRMAQVASRERTLFANLGIELD